MKKTIALLYILLVSTCSFAQTIHWLTFVDTTDENVGQADVTGRKVLYDHFVNVVNSALNSKGYTADIQDFSGANTSPENCKKAINALRCSKEDIIVFYYIGHGGRPATESTKEHPWPQMCMAQHIQNKYIPLEWVGQQLSAKGARLSVTIGMCCNSMSDRITSKTGPTFSANYGATYLSDAKIRNIQNLFLNERGNVLATSASPKQSSYALDIQGFGYMDVYTAALCSIFEKALDEPVDINWNMLLNTVSDTVEDFVMSSISRSQSPFHKCTLTAAQQPAPASKQTESAPQISNNSGSNDLHTIGTWLDALVNTNISEAGRIGFAQKVVKALSTVGKVKLMSQDGDVVIDSDDISTYINRLATSRIIIKAIPVSIKKEGTQTVLRIKEVYKK